MENKENVKLSALDKRVRIMSRPATFTQDNGQVRNYVEYLIEVGGIWLKIKPCDATCRQLIDSYLANNA